MDAPLPQAVPTKDQLDYALKHFLFIADQRMRVFNFYIILSAASFGATLTTIAKIESRVPFLVCGVIHIGIALMFAVIDERSRRLIKLTRAAIVAIEQSPDWPPAARISNQDSIEMASPLKRAISYTGAFRAAFVIQGIFGTGIVICALFFHPHSKPAGGVTTIQQTQPTIVSPTSVKNTAVTNSSP